MAHRELWHKLTVTCVDQHLKTGFVEPCASGFSGAKHPGFKSVLLPRDDAFSDSLSQKADSEASSGPLLDDKASSKNDLQSPTEHISDYGFGGVMGR